MNLKNTIDTLDLIPEIDEKFAAEPDIMQKNTFMDIFKKRKNDNFKSQDLEEINKFNLSIINNTKWGTDSMNKGRMEPKSRMVMKPTQKELEKEIGKKISKKFKSFFFKNKINFYIFVGMNIANTKLPRSRIFNVNKSYNMN